MKRNTFNLTIILYYRVEIFPRYRDIEMTSDIFKPKLK